MNYQHRRRAILVRVVRENVSLEAMDGSVHRRNGETIGRKRLVTKRKNQ